MRNILLLAMLVTVACDDKPEEKAGADSNKVPAPTAPSAPAAPLIFYEPEPTPSAPPTTTDTTTDTSTDTDTDTSTDKPKDTTTDKPKDTPPTDDEKVTDTPTTPGVVTYFTTNTKDEKLAKIVVSRHYEAPNDYFTLDIAFTALKDLKGGSAVPRVRVILAHHDDWRLLTKTGKEHIKSSYYYTKKGKRKYFKVILKAMQQDDHFSLKFTIPNEIIAALSDEFDFLLTITHRGKPLSFLSADGKTPAAGTFPDS